MFSLITKAKLLALTLLSFTVNASLILPEATIDFGGQSATDSSGITSSFVPANNLLNPANGYYIETFDEDTQMIGFVGQDTSYNDLQTLPDDHGCGVNTFGAPGIDITTSQDGFGVKKGNATGDSHGIAAQPGGNDPFIGDFTCFGFTPGRGGAIPGFVEVDYSNFLPEGVLINYFGFYWGSVDDYNDFTFFSGDSSFTLTGTQLLNELGGDSGDRTGDGSNTYVNIAFNDGFAFDKFRVDSRGIAGEFDNIVIGLTNREPTQNTIPEPNALLLLGLSLVMLYRRVKK